MTQRQPDPVRRLPAHCMWLIWLVNLVLGGIAIAADEARSLCVINARVFDQSAADSIVVRAGRITSVGRRADVAAALPANTLIIDARGGLVIPGLHDAHIHMLSGGWSLLQLDLNEHRELAPAIAAIAKYAELHPGNHWLQGRGWQYDVVPPGKYPQRQDLDRVVGHRPVFLISNDGHTAWVNSRALELAGIDANTADPRDGQIVREADGQTPAGILVESAIALVRRVVPQPSRGEQLHALSVAVQHCSKLGLTSVTDLTDPDALPLYAELLKTDRLPLRVSVSLPLAGNIRHYAQLRADYDSPFLRLGFLKDFVDGVVESKTAYMLDPYNGTTDRGKPNFGRQRLAELVAEARAHGFVVGLHAIGDGAVRLSLDAFDHAAGESELRGRIEHIEVLHPQDASRFRSSKVIASMQPLHANPGGPHPDDGAWSKLVGPDRRRHSFPWRDLLDAGATLAFGSDWPVMSADPLWGIAVATTRRDMAGEPADGWNAHQRITAREAIRAYTAGAAMADGVARDRGKIAPGYLADLVVLAPHVDLENPATLWQGERVRYVIVDGRVRIEPAQP